MKGLMQNAEFNYPYFMLLLPLEELFGFEPRSKLLFCFFIASLFLLSITSFESPELSVLNAFDRLDLLLMMPSCVALIKFEEAETG